jgi:hypothetical protein
MFSRFFSLLLLLLTCGLASAQPLPDRQPLVGVALDDAGKPVPGVYIALRRQDGEGSYAFWGAATATDGHGQFKFSQAEIGRYYLNAELEGFAPIYNQPVTWNTKASPLQVRMNRLVNLTLKLSLPDGSPAKNVAVWVRLRGEGYAGQTTRQAVSDGNGLVVLDDLQPSNYSMVLSTSAGYLIKDRFPLRSNSTEEVPLKVGGSLRVTVKEPGTSSRGLGGARVSLIPQDQEEAIRMLGDAATAGEDFAVIAAMGQRIALVSREGDGVVSVSNLPAGRYMLKVSGAAFPGQNPRPVTITAGETTALDWVVTPKQSSKASLELQLRDEVGKAASGDFELRLLPIASNGSLVLNEITGEAPGGDTGRRATADGSGRINVYPLAPGRYRFFVSPARPQDSDDEITESPSVDVIVTPSGATASIVLKRVP